MTEAGADLFDIAAVAVLRASYGAPSTWGAANPPGWHLPDACSPRDASMHDNGVNDAFSAVREAQRTTSPSHSTASLARQLADSLEREAELHRTVATLKSDLGNAVQQWDEEGTRANEVQIEVERLEQRLKLYEDALSEAEAIFGGEYADHYGPMFDLAMKARDA